MSDHDWFRQQIADLREAIARIIVGQDDVVSQVLMALVCDGHVLLEGVPGLGKTLLVRTLSSCLGLSWSRIQFTPDLMPADIIGTHILEPDETGRRTLRFDAGPVFTQLLLADEINRATPKTQSALLEAMQERQVTTGGTRRPLPDPFFVMATQNPLEMEGTYPLPEAQLDRFFFKVHVPFPSAEELAEIMRRTTGSHVPQTDAVTDPEALRRMRQIVREVPIAPEVLSYAMRLIVGSHPDQPGGTEAARKSLAWGASPRAGQTLILAGRARALLQNRPHVAFADIRAVVLPALRHRVGLNFEAQADGTTADAVLSDLLDQVPEVL